MLAHWDRIQIYVRDLECKTNDGFYRLTPAQKRRAQKKYNKRGVSTDGVVYVDEFSAWKESQGVR